MFVAMPPWLRQLIFLTEQAKYELPEEEIEDNEKTVVISHEPLGVVAAICPWNCKSISGIRSCRYLLTLLPRDSSIDAW